MQLPVTLFLFRSPWEKAVTVPGKNTKATVPDLKEGEEYEFRVTAINKGGPGKPSDASDIVITKPRFRKLKHGYLLFFTPSYKGMPMNSRLLEGLI